MAQQLSAPPLRVAFVITSLPVGGAETLLLNLIQRLDRQVFEPEVVCLKEPGELGDAIARQVPLYANLLKSKWDSRILTKLTHLFRQREIEVVITVGAGDKMFWGRLAARWAGVPVVCSALHSTGWPDGVGRLNRLLTPITDGFIAVAQPHAEYMAEHERFPAERIFVIPNGVDADRFRPNHATRQWLRSELQIPGDSQIVGIVAALRDEKNHGQFIDAANDLQRRHPKAHFVIVGDGPERAAIEAKIESLQLASRFHLLGSRSDTEHLLAGMDVFCLTSRNEANPVSILEALACGIPVVAPDVGSIRETVIHQKTGFLTEPLSADSTSEAISRLLADPDLAIGLGRAGRQHIRGSWTLDSMVRGYEGLMRTLLARKRPERVLPVASTRLVNPAVNGTSVAAGFGFAPVEGGLGVLPLNAPLADNDFVSV
jgi:glycosyltransferase involved in cell wall biosynthesis